MDKRLDFRTYEEGWTSLRVGVKSPLVIRVDGKNFSKLLKEYGPFDPDHTEAMILSCIETIKIMSSFVVAFVQSDEISFVVSNDIRPETQPWLGYNIQKVSSITASSVSVNYSWLMSTSKEKMVRGIFDGRSFPLSLTMVKRYIRNRMINGGNNAVVSAYRHHIGTPKGKNLSATLAALEDKDIEIEPIYKYGLLIYKYQSLFVRISPSVLPDDELDNLIDNIYENLRSGNEGDKG